MGFTKDKWLDQQHEDPKNWYTKKCSYCGESFRANKITKREPDPVLGYCFECYGNVILEEKG